MMQRKSHALLIIVLLFLIMCCRTASVLAAVEVKVHSILDLDKSPMDIVTSGDGKWAFILMPGEVQVFSLNTKSLLGRFPVDKDIRRISISSRGDQVYLMNEKSKTLSIAGIAFVDMFNVTGSPFKGPVNAPVIITVFSDYQWPSCAQIQTLLQQVLEQFPTEVKLVHKDGPIAGHPLSRQASIAALAAGEQNKYWEYHDKIMQNMSGLSPDSFIEFAKELGLDMDAFKKSLMDPKHEKHIEKDAQDAINADAMGRPAIFVNGRAYTRFQTMDALKERINEELNKKKK